MTEQNQQNSLLGKIAAYTEILAKDPKSTIFVSLGEAYRKMGMLDDARQVIDMGLAKHPDFGPAHIVLGRILCQQGEYKASESAFQSALESDPDSLAALVGYARLCILLGQEGKAREILLRARDLSPADPVINKLLLSLPEPVQVTVAEDHEDKSVSAGMVSSEPAMPVSSDAKEAPPLISTTLAELYLKQGLTEQALEVYRQLSAANPDDLLFRRKIRELENGRSADDEEIAETVEDVACKSEDVLNGTFVAEPEDAAKSANDDVAGEEAYCPTADTLSADDKAIVELNRWLDSIRKRREDV